MLGLLVLMAIAQGLLIALLVTMLAWQMTHPPRRTAAWALARSLPSDPNDLNLRFEEWWLDRPGGSRLPVWEISTPSSPDSTGGRLTAVFVHGWGHGRVSSLQRIEPFLPLVARIALYDLRGHGESDGSASTLGHGEDHDLLALLERLGPGPFLLIGHSMGAVIALLAAMKAPSGQAIEGVIAYGPYCDFHCSLRGRLRVNGLPARPLSDLALLLNRVRGVRPPGVDPAQLKSLDVPLLMVHGVHDQVSPLEHARAIADAAPKAQLIEVDDAAHADTHWVNREAHDRAVRAFVERIASSQEPHSHY